MIADCGFLIVEVTERHPIQSSRNDLDYPRIGRKNNSPESGRCQGLGSRASKEVSQFFSPEGHARQVKRELATRVAQGEAKRVRLAHEVTME